MSNHDIVLKLENLEKRLDIINKISISQEAEIKELKKANEMIYVELYKKKRKIDKYEKKGNNSHSKN